MIPPRRLRVLSYNIQGLPSIAASLLGVDHDRYALIGELLKERRAQGTAPHIVAIQEAFHKKHRELIERAGYPYVSYGPGRSWLKSNSGLCVLSEFPIVETYRTVFLHSIGWDFMVRKGAQHVKIQVPGVEHPVSVMNTHLNADSGNWLPDFITRWVRIQQAKHLRKFLRNTWEALAPLICVGDFNFLPNQKDYISFVNFGEGPAIKNAALEHFRSQPTHSKVVEDYFHTIDHQFIFSPAVPSRSKLSPVHFEKMFREPIGGRPLSDHEGIEIHYDLQVS